MKITEVTKQINEVDLRTFMNRASEVLNSREGNDLLNSINQDYGGDPNRWLIQAKRDSDDWFQNPSNRAIRDKIFGIASGLGGGEPPNPPVVNLDDVPTPTRGRGAANASTNVDIPLAPRVVGARPEGPAGSMPAARPGGARPEGPAGSMPAAEPAAAPGGARPEGPAGSIPAARPAAARPGGARPEGPAGSMPAAEPAAAEPAAAPSAVRPPPRRPGQETSGPDLSQITQTLRRGSRGEAVRVLQQALGMSGNAVDGVFGPATERAVREFQQRAGIQVDGIVGRQTLAALEDPDDTLLRAVTPGRIGNAPASAPAQQQSPQPTPVDPQAAAAVARTDLNGRRRIGTDAGDGMVWIVGNTNALTRVMPNDPRVAAQRAAVAARNESRKTKTNSLVEGIKKLAGISNKKKLNEASMNISLNADSSAEVAELLRIMQLAGAGGAKPVDVGMLNQPDSHTGGCGCSKCAAKMGASDPSMGDMIRMISSEEEETDGKFSQASTAPDEKYMNDVSASIPNGNDLNKKKNSYAATAGGDNPMNVGENVESIKDRLMAALSEAKKNKKPKQRNPVAAYAQKSGAGVHKDQNKKSTPARKEKHKGKVYAAEGAKPDFLDMDKDGNKKEPMKKAIADKKKSPVKEAEFQTPSHELDDTARKATNIAQMIKRKINSGEKMDDMDYNQMAELGAILSRFGTSFGPQSMKDVMKHMVQYTDDRNEYGTGYPEFTVDRFKELLAMAK